MAISVYRWTDGPYLAFTDDKDRRYVLERERAIALFERMHAHLCDAPNRTFVVNRRFTRDPQRDLMVLDMYLQDCDNLVEIMTKSSPILRVSLQESCTVLRLAVETAPSVHAHHAWEPPAFLQESVLTGMTTSAGLLGSTFG